jgi:amino acid transporter
LLIAPILGAFTFAITLFYGITDLDAVLNSNGSFPLAEVYAQATGSTGATFGLLFIIFLSLAPCLIGTFLTVGRTWWALARDNAVPFSGFFSKVDEDLSCPIPATIFTGIMTTAFGAITLGSKAAFSDLVGSFVILTTTSYALAIGGHLFTGRKNLPIGPFCKFTSSIYGLLQTILSVRVLTHWVVTGLGKWGYGINAVAVITIIFFNIIFCFPYALPVETATMNYNSVILAGVVTLTTLWWFVHALRNYSGPKLGGIEETEEGRRLSTV